MRIIGGEGPIPYPEIPAVTFAGDGGGSSAWFWWRCDTVLRAHAIRVCTPNATGYWKTDVVFRWADGESMQFRFDLIHPTHPTPDHDSDASKHLRRHFGFHSGAWCPDHLTDQQFAEYMSHTQDSAIREALAHWVGRDLGDSAIGGRLMDSGTLAGAIR